MRCTKTILRQGTTSYPESLLRRLEGRDWTGNGKLSQVIANIAQRGGNVFFVFHEHQIQMLEMQIAFFAINAQHLKKTKTLRDGQPVKAWPTARFVTGTQRERRQVCRCLKSRVSPTSGPMKKLGKNILLRHYKHIYFHFGCFSWLKQCT